MSIRVKLLAGFGVIALLFGALTVENRNMLNEGISAIEEARDQGYAAAVLAKEIKLDVIQVQQWLTDISATRGAEGFDDGFDEAARYAADLYTNIDALMRLRPELRDDLEGLRTSFTSFYEKGQWMAERYIAEGPAGGNAAMEEFDAFAEDIGDRVETLVASMSDLADHSLQASIDQAARSKQVSLWFTSIALALSVLIALFLSRAISTPLGKMTRAMNQIATVELKELTGVLQQLAQGDLTGQFKSTATPIASRSRDEIGKMASSFNTMVKQLKDSEAAYGQMISRLNHLVGQVASDAQKVGHASSQLSETAVSAGETSTLASNVIQEVALKTTEQIESIQMAAQTMENVADSIEEVARGAREQAEAVDRSFHITTEMAHVIQQIAANARSSADGSALAANAARDGADSIRQTIQGMTGIKQKVGISTQKVREMGERSDQIGAIVQTIGDIASQTNLLALNAAIEAARAGEQGKGFAVVADEVRLLAEKATAATGQISTLINTIQQALAEAVTAMAEGAEEVELGVQRADDAGQTLTRFLDAVQQVNRQVEEIAQATHQMDGSSGELVEAMERVSKVVRDNTAATESMTDRARAVTGAINRMTRVAVENSKAIESVSANAENMSMSDQVAEVTTSAQSLAGMARNLRTLVEQFKLAEGTIRTAEPSALIKTANKGASTPEQKKLQLFSDSPA
ncbi:MAG: methyl-accepting chemotaxis protein [Rhodothermales bacterium]